MKHLLVVLQTVVCFAVTTFAAPQRAAHVFIVSFDQGSPAGIAKSDMPLVKAMATEGAHTWSAYTIVPSLTLPAHTSMLTGVGIQKHQILWNDYSPARGLVKVPTIFSIAKEHALSTAMFVCKEKFKTLQLPGSVDVFVLPESQNAKGVAEAFVAQVGALQPNLCFIHFGDPDAAGHKYGMDSPEKMQSFADCDAALKIIKDAVAAAGMADSSVFLLTADHGGHDVAELKNGQPTGKMLGTHGSPETDDVVIPWIASGKGVKKGYTITAPVVVYDTAATALWLLGIDVPAEFWGRPVTTAFESQ